MKKIFLFALLTFLCTELHGQYMLKAGYYRVNGEYGFYTKPTVAIEAAYVPSFEGDIMRLQAGIMVVPMRKRMDYYPTVRTESNSSQFIIDSFAIEQQFLFQLNGGMDFQLYENDAFSTFCGVDAMAGLYLANHSPWWYLGFRIRAGLEYDFSDSFTFQLSYNNNLMMTLEDEHYMSAHDLGVGVIFIF